MNWFAENWFWVLFAVAFIAMHLFGHGGHGGHGGHCGHGGHGSHDGDPRSGGELPKNKPEESGAAQRPGSTNAHHH